MAIGRKSLTKADMESWLVADGRGIKLVGEYTNTYTKTIFECAHMHQWKSTPRNVKSGRGCPVCAIEARPTIASLFRLTKSDIESRLVADDRGIKIIGEYTNSKTKTTFECTHGHQWMAQPNSIMSGRGCTICSSINFIPDKSAGFSPDKPGWEYIFTRDSYLKYGISNNLNRRLSEHKRYGDIEIAHLKHHENGQDALDWENSIKKTHGGKYVTAVWCPDGWTETLPITYLKILLEESK